MKIVGLLPFRNEREFLPLYLSSIEGIVDEIVAFDHGSTDEGASVLEKAGAQVERGAADRSRGPQASEHLRDRLLERGRAAGGSHFVILDADEAFTAPFRHVARSAIADLAPGERLYLRWYALWKDPLRYRDDASVWSGAWKDFIVRDDPQLGYPVARLHGPRTPRSDSIGTERRLGGPGAGVFHFQFVPWDRFQMKQAWYRCWELVATERSPLDINHTYRFTLDRGKVRTREVPLDWYEGLDVPDDLATLTPGWYEEDILSWFDHHGIERFEPLDIWHIPRLRAEFETRAGRAPRRSMKDRLKAARTVARERLATTTAPARRALSGRSR